MTQSLGRRFTASFHDHSTTSFRRSKPYPEHPASPFLKPSRAAHPSEKSIFRKGRWCSDRADMTGRRLCFNITKSVADKKVMLKHNLRMARQSRSVRALAVFAKVVDGPGNCVFEIQQAGLWAWSADTTKVRRCRRSHCLTGTRIGSSMSPPCRYPPSQPSVTSRNRLRMLKLRQKMCKLSWPTAMLPLGMARRLNSRVFSQKHAFPTAPSVLPPTSIETGRVRVASAGRGGGLVGPFVGRYH